MPLFGETAKRAMVTLPSSENISPLKPHGNAKNARGFSFHQRLNRSTYFCNQSLCLESLNQIIWRGGQRVIAHLAHPPLNSLLDAAGVPIRSLALASTGADRTERHVLKLTAFFFYHHCLKG